MKHTDRRKELGKMLMDVAKYLATIGLIGGILTKNITAIAGFVTVAVVGFLILVAFYVIPPKNGE